MCEGEYKHSLVSLSTRCFNDEVNRVIISFLHLRTSDDGIMK